MLKSLRKLVSVIKLNYWELRYEIALWREERAQAKEDDMKDRNAWLDAELREMFKENDESDVSEVQSLDEFLGVSKNDS